MSKPMHRESSHSSLKAADGFNTAHSTPAANDHVGNDHTPAAAADIYTVCEGWALKRGSRKNWNERYFVLRNTTLCYYVQRADVKPKGAYELAGGECEVSDVYICKAKDKGVARHVMAVQTSSERGDSVGEAGLEYVDLDMDEDDAEAAMSGANSTCPGGSGGKDKKEKKSKDKKAKEGKGKLKLYCVKISWPSLANAAATATAMAHSAETTLAERNAQEAASASAAGIAAGGFLSPVNEDPTSSPPRSPASLHSAALNERSAGGPASAHNSQQGGGGGDHMAGSYMSDTSHLHAPSLIVQKEGSAVPSHVTQNLRQESPMRIAARERSKPASCTPHRRVRSDAGPSPRFPSPLKPGARNSSGGARSPTPGGAGLEGQQHQLTPPKFESVHASPPATPNERSRSDGDAPLSMGAPPLPSEVGGSLDEDENERTAAVAVDAMGDEGINKHYTEQIAAQSKAKQQVQEEMIQSLYIAAKKASQKRTKKRIVKGSKIAAVGGAAVTAGVLTAGVGLVAGLVVVGVSAAVGGTGAAGAKYKKTKKNAGTSVIIAVASLNEANRWKSALEASIAGAAVEDSTWTHLFELEGRKNTASYLIPSEPDITGREISVAGMGGVVQAAVGDPSKLTREARQNLRLPEDRAEYYVEPGTTWRPLEGGWATLLGTGAHGLRIFREEREPEPFLMFRNSMKMKRIFRRQISVEGRPCPPLKAQIILNASPLNAFMCLMSNARADPSRGAGPGDSFELPLSPSSGQRASFRIIETLDDHMDVIHLVFRPLYLFPSWTAPRDYVLFRYWRFEADGTYTICMDTVQHRECPPIPSHVRGELYGVYTIAPRKSGRGGALNPNNSPGPGNRLNECLLTSVVQVDPRGWVPTVSLPPLASQGYGEAFAVSALLQVLDVRDALDYDRFVNVPLDIQPPTHKAKAKDFPMPLSSTNNNRFALDETTDTIPSISQAPSIESADEEYNEDSMNYDFKYALHEMPSSWNVQAEEDTGSISTHPAPLEMKWWAEPDPNSFRVRGKTYKKDKKKINAGSSMFRLICADIVETEAIIYSGMCSHPKERVQLALERERKAKGKREETGDNGMPPFVVLVNIMLPGPPCYHMLFYYAVDNISTIDGSDGTPSSILAKEFFFGDDDKFRDRTFKLIPQIVEGNFMVRKAVGSTPAIMGTKLKQTYVRGERFFELLLDCGSSSVAAGVIRLCNGYARTVVVDMAFLLEGNDESTLPEKLMGCVRLKNVDFGSKLRFVDLPDDFVEE